MTAHQSREDELKSAAKAGRGRASVSQCSSAPGKSGLSKLTMFPPRSSQVIACTNGGTALERGILARAFPPRCCPIHRDSNFAREIPGRDQLTHVLACELLLALLLPLCTARLALLVDFPGRRSLCTRMPLRCCSYSLGCALTLRFLGCLLSLAPLLS